MIEVYEDKLSTVPWAVSYNGQVKARFMSYRLAIDYASKMRLRHIERPGL